MSIWSQSQCSSFSIRVRVKRSIKAILLLTVRARALQLSSRYLISHMLQRLALWTRRCLFRQLASLTKARFRPIKSCSGKCRNASATLNCQACDGRRRGALRLLYASGCYSGMCATIGLSAAAVHVHAACLTSG